MENSPIKEEETKGMSSEIDPSSSDNSSHQEDPVFGIDKGSQKHEKLQVEPFYRVHPPATYSITFDSYAKMVELVKDGYYESLPFTSGGFNWTFKIYPNGNKKEAAAGFVSVYARIDDSVLVTNPQDVYAEIKFFVYNGVNRQYYTHQENEPIKFDNVKSEWGVAKFLSTVYFGSGSAFIYDGEKCEFGIDIFVTKRNKREVFSYDENVTNPIFNWNLTKFSTLTSHDSYTSNTFSSGDRNWALKVYPNGHGVGKDKYLSLYQLSGNNEYNYVHATLRVLNKIPSNNVAKQVEGWTNAAENGWGFQEFIPLADLQDKCKGFVVDDLLQVQVEITAFSKRTPLN